MIVFEDFLKVDVRVGEIKEVKTFEEARVPAYKLWIDFGEDVGVKKTSAQITKNYEPDTLIGKQVLAVVNFPPKQIGNFMSEVLVLGVPDQDNQVVLITPDEYVPQGGRLY
jgi:tRNA-binding protein